MGKKLYVGNLPYSTTSSELEQMFKAHGTVQSAEVISDRETGRSKGFGFVEMSSDQEAEAAIAALNGKDQGGRALTVNEANRAKSVPVEAVVVAEADMAAVGGEAAVETVAAVDAIGIDRQPLGKLNGDYVNT